MPRFYLTALLLTACNCVPPPPIPDAGPCTLEVQWGREPNCVFTPFADAQNAEMTLGFQGFRFVESAVRVTGAREPSAKLAFDLAIEGQSPAVQPAGTLDLQPGPDGALYAHQVLLFLNDVPLAELIGKRADVMLAATVAGCRATDRVNVTLVDEDPSIQGADAGLSCSP
jgi:hypothetical protein